MSAGCTSAGLFDDGGDRGEIYSLPDDLSISMEAEYGAVQLARHDTA